VTVNDVELVALPAGVCTPIGPDFEPVGTIAVIVVSLSTVNDASLPLKVTAVAPVRPVPLIVTDEPQAPPVGEKPVIDGVAIAVVTWKLVELVAVPPDVVTEIGPVVAPEGTVATICDEPSLAIVALVPLNVTDVAFDRFEPLMVTLVPTGPLVGVKLLIMGAETVEPVQPGSVNEPIRVSQSSSAFVVGWAS